MSTSELVGAVVGPETAIETVAGGESVTQAVIPPARRSGVVGTLSHPAVATVVGLGLLIGAWWLAAHLNAGTDTIATPPAVARAMWEFRSDLWSQSGATLSEAAIGFAGGSLIGVALAIAFVQVKAAEKAVLQLAIVTHCLPVVAIGPLLELLLHGREPRFVMSALLVFFPTVVTVQLGLRRTDKVALEIVRAYGGRGWAQLRYVRLMHAVPYILTACKIAAPLALLGAILGEFMGGTGGLGVLIISSQQSGMVARTWGVAMACTLWSILSFLAFGLLGRILAPWAPKGASQR